MSIVVAGCGIGRLGGATSSTTTSLRAVAPCLAGTGARTLIVRGSRAAPVGRGNETFSVEGAILGTSGAAIVMSNESNSDLCGWSDYVGSLLNAGFQVVLYNYPDEGAAADSLTAVVGYLRDHGLKKITLMGASLGAMVSIVVGASLQPAPSAVVSLSAEAWFPPLEVGPFAAKLTTPTLFVTAADDPWGAAEANQSFYESAPASVKQLIVVPGDAHGWDLLTDGYEESVVTPILTFLQHHSK
ncbi:MAG TPA: hypothetical protein VHQ03_10740 [Candidatus Dormibacteraeota bacterium]|nr:hypothetical protein [Candidatus Dormibacteraeota bacterium]